jgi:hypothetical protein
MLHAVCFEAFEDRLFLIIRSNSLLLSAECSMAPETANKRGQLLPMLLLSEAARWYALISANARSMKATDGCPVRHLTRNVVWQQLWIQGSTIRLFAEYGAISALWWRTEADDDVRRIGGHPTTRFYLPALELKSRHRGNERTKAGLPNNVIVIYVKEKSTHVVGPLGMPPALSFGGVTIRRDLAILALSTWYTAAARASAR